MHYHILLTEKCNAQCKYCYEKSIKEAELENNLSRKFKFDFSAPESSEVEVHKLKKFLSKDTNPTLIFYGGEPLLEIPKITEIMDNIDMPFRMQTNGKLLNQLPIKYLKRIGKILISIDGNKERTDFNKGQGTYDLIIKNLVNARKQGYKGELVARMTISPYSSENMDKSSPESHASDLFEQATHLLSLNLFDSIHWQLDAGFYKFDFNKEKFSKFAEEYNKSTSRLIDFWIQNMKVGEVIKLYPFLAITQSLLKNEKTKLRCGAGYEGYAITTNGKIVACPIMNSIVDFEAGSLNDSPKNLLKFEVPFCNKCEYLALCGGRCLYWRSSGLWPKEGDDLICGTIKHLIDYLKSKLPEIKSLIDKGIISEKNFNYEKYFGPEIIP